MRKNPWILFFVFVLGLLLGFGGTFFFKPTSPRNESDVIYAQVQGTQIRAKDVADKVETQLQQLSQRSYEIKRRAVEDLIRERFLGQPPRLEENQDDSWKNIEISKEELSQFLKTQNLDPHKISPSTRENILNNLKFQKMRSQQASLEQNQFKQLKIRWQIPLPDQPKIDPGQSSVKSRGEDRARVSIFLVGNLHCPACLETEKKLAEIRKQYEKDIQISYRFAIADPETSSVYLTAEAAICADRQNRFWPFYEKALRKPIQSIADVKSVAVEIGLDQGQFERCLSLREARAVIEKDVEWTQKMNFPEIPYLIINGRSLSGRSSLDQISDTVGAFLSH